MKFYTGTHKFYCGIDLHAKTMYLCILDQQGEIVRHKNIRSTRETFLDAIAQYREDIVVGVECILPGIGLQISVHKKTSPLFSVTPFI